MRRYQVSIKGTSPLLMHADNVAWQDILKKWYIDPANKGKSTNGDDRTPPFTWIGYLYTEAKKVVMPSDNLMSTIRNGGAMCPRGKGKMTFKSQSQSGLVVDQSAWPLIVNGKEIPYEPIHSLIEEPDFSVHEKTVQEYGFELFVKRATIGNQKHVRVRPRFDAWECAGSITVFDDEITTDVLKNILNYAGTYSGLGDWRPKSPKAPGPFGKFIPEIREMKT